MTPSVRRVLWLQLGVSVTSAGLFATLSGSVAAVSALVGGLVCLLGSVFYALRVGFTKPLNAAHAFWQHALGEGMKIAVTLGLIAVLFSRYGDRIAALPLLITFIVATLCYWVALLLPE